MKRTFAEAMAHRRRRRLQRKSRCHGVPGSTRRQPSGNLSLRADVWNNNIGEFLAIVHGLALLKQKGFDMPIYSDSVNAINWIKQKKCKTKLPRDAKTEELSPHCFVSHFRMRVV